MTSFEHTELKSQASNFLMGKVAGKDQAGKLFSLKEAVIIGERKLRKMEEEERKNRSSEDEEDFLSLDDDDAHHQPSRKSPFARASSTRSSPLMGARRYSQNSPGRVSPIAMGRKIPSGRFGDKTALGSKSSGTSAQVSPTLQHEGREQLTGKSRERHLISMSPLKGAESKMGAVSFSSLVSSEGISKSESVDFNGSDYESASPSSASSRTRLPGIMEATGSIQLGTPSKPPSRGGDPRGVTTGSRSAHSGEARSTSTWLV